MLNPAVAETAPLKPTGSEKWDFGCLVMGFVTKGMLRVNLALISVRSRTKGWVYGEKIISC